MRTSLTVFRALADPSRLRIVALARHMELAIGELAQVLRQSQPRVSRHVKILADAGLIERHKEGAWVFIRLGRSDRVGPALAALDAWDGDDATLDTDRARLAAVRAERVAAAEEYFADHAQVWDNIRTLHIGDTAVEAAIMRALGRRPLGDLLDVGTGTGRMIELLGPSAERAVGIDRSPEMLRVARGKLEAAGVPRWQVRQADMHALPQADGTIDTVVLHHVLHFTPTPADAVREAARVLAPGGRLLIIDFASHDHEELRAMYAHARLGFEDEQVISWMEAAELQGRVVEHLDGGPLTVTLWVGERAGLTRAEAA